MKKTFIQLLSLCAFSLLLSCSTETTITIDYKKDISTSAVDKIIIPRLDTLLEKSNALHASISTLETSFTIANFKKAQQHLVEVSEVYAKMYAFNIGEVKNQFMNRKINFWPVYNISIEKTINEGNFNQEFVSNLGSAAKNLPGLNYLLFKHKDAQNALLEYSSNGNRVQFLILVSNEFHERIKELYSIWSTTGSDFANLLKNNDATGLLSSFNLIYNGLYNVIDNCKVTKIGKPAGLEKSSHTNADIVENFYANNSLDLIYNNIVSVEELFFSTEITSIAAYIESILKNDVLTNKIQENIRQSKALIEGMTVPLKVAVDSDKASIEILHDHLSELLVLMHTDVRSALSIIITGTDNDGD